MKQFLCRLLALIMVIGTLAPAIEAEAKYETPAPVNSAPATESGTKPAGTVKLKYLNPSKFQVREGKYKFTNEADSDKLVTMSETAQVKDGVLTTRPDAPAITGWTFAGWYTAPVSYAFWGDTPTTDYSDYEEIPFQYDCDGNIYENKLVLNGKNGLNGEDQWTQRLESYWIWLSALGEGNAPGVGGKVTVGDKIPEGVTALYARYEPTKIEYKLYYQGWNGTDGVLQCTRQYGTPFGRLEMDGWDGYTFDGWYTEPTGGDRVDDFYDIPGDGSSYYAHWKSIDGTVTHENYKTSGSDTVTSLSLRDGEEGKGLKDLGDILELPDAQGYKNITVVVTPSDCGVTDLEWELRDGDSDDSYVIGNDTDSSFSDKIVKVERTGNKLEVLVRATGERGTTKLTVRTKDGRISDSVIIDTGVHSFDEVEVTQWGSCSKPTIRLYTCVICRKTKTVESYANHNWAWRDIPGTCTTDHVWEHYCKVCGAVDPDENTRYWEQSKAPGHQFRTTTTSGCGGTVTTRTCTVCGYTQSTVDGEGVHNWSSEPTVDVRPTCHSDGSKSVKCLDCGAVKPGSSEKIPRDASLHTWDPWVVVTEPTETEPGEQTRTCSSCKTVETRAIPPTGIKDDPYKIANDVKTQVVSGADKVVVQAEVAETIQKTIQSLLDNKNRDMLADDIYFASLQSQEISATIKVTPVAAPEDGDDFSDLLGSGATVAYMDIDILVKAGDQNLGKITQTSGEIMFKAALPALPGEGDSVRVLRAHEGKVEEIDNCRVENGSVYFSADKFSTFAVVVGNTSSSTHGGGSGGGSGGVPGGTPGHGEQVHICPTDRYMDVVRSEWYHDGVDYAVKNGLMAGKAEGIFDPNGITTRAEMVTILYRLDGNPAVTRDVEFSDIPAGQWYSDAVSWAAANKIVDGYGSGKFGPDDTVTREQMAAILYRYAGYKGYDLTNLADITGYNDAGSVSIWADTAMKWAVAEGIIEGTGTTSLSPSGNSTRAQVATVFMRFREDIAK